MRMTLFLGDSFVNRFALCYRTVVLSVCPVCNVGVWPNGWMDQDATWYGCSVGPADIVLHAQQPLTFQRMFKLVVQGS